MTYDNNSHQFEALNRESSLAPDWQQHNVDQTQANQMHIKEVSDLLLGQKDKVRSFAQKIKSRALDITPLIAVTLVACSGGGGGNGVSRDVTQAPVTPPPLGGSDVVFAPDTPDSVRLITGTDGSTTAQDVGAPVRAEVEDDTIVYSIEGPSEFSIETVMDADNNAVGQIRYAGAAAVRGQSYTLTITATPVDGGAESAVTRTLTIEVFDSANPPAFGDSTGTFRLDENADGSTTPITLGTITIDDPDTTSTAQGTPAVESYALVGAPAGFEIHAMTGVITYTGSGVDFESNPSFTLTVMATADGEPITMEVTVNVNNLVVTITGASLSLAENADGSSTAVPVGMASAVLSGNTHSTAGAAAYALDAASMTAGFAIDAGTGAITYTGSGVDFEATPSFTLMVTATINGESTTTPLTVSVTDVAEATTGVPTVTSPNNDLGVVLTANIDAIMDPDGIDGITYQWEFATFSEGVFRPVAGETRQTITTDDTDVGNYRVVVTVRDNHGTTEVTSAAVPVGDAPPVVNIPTTLNYATGASAVTYDLDPSNTDSNAAVFDDMAGATVAVDVSGANGLATYVGTTLTIMPGSSAATGTVVITATDSAGQVTTHTINIGVTAPADATFAANAPTTAMLSEFASADTEVVTGIVATDSNPEDSIAYSISDDRFTISQAGVITYIGGGTALDYEDSSARTIALVVTATSTGTNGMPTEVDHTVTVTITNENEDPTGTITISGPRITGMSVSAAGLDSIMDPDGLAASPTYTYQWLRDGTEITGATSASYILQAADEGRQISVRVDFTDEGMFDESLTSTTISPEAPPPAFRSDVSSLPVQTGRFDGALADTVMGTAADEIIQGSDFGDTITSGGGDDILIGGYGVDTINLGAGEDIIIHRLTPPPTGGSDPSYVNADSGGIINDFTPGQDKFYFIDPTGTITTTAQFLDLFTQNVGVSIRILFSEVDIASDHVTGFQIRFTVAGDNDAAMLPPGAPVLDANLVINYATAIRVKDANGNTPEGERLLGPNNEFVDFDQVGALRTNLPGGLDRVLQFFGTGDDIGLRVITDAELMGAGVDIL